MADIASESASPAAALAAELQRGAQLHAMEVQELAALQRAIAQTNERNIELHQKSLQAISEIRAGLQDVQKRLRSLATARA
jgi:hypothetical protein